MIDSRNRSEHVIHAHGSSPEKVANHLLQTLIELLGAAGEERDSAMVVPVQASGVTLEDLLESLVGDLLDIVDSSPTQVVDAELSHVMKTGDGLRAWGYVWFGKEASTDRSPSLKSPLELSTFENGELDVRVTLLVSVGLLGHGSDVVEVPDRR